MILKNTIKQMKKKMQNSMPMAPVTRNCNSCILCDDVIGCRLTGGLSPARCVFNGFAYYKKGKQLFYCERCGTNSVKSCVAGFRQKPSDPRITFWCQKCNDYPIIEGEEYMGYRVEGIIFTCRMNTYLERRAKQD